MDWLLISGPSILGLICSGALSHYWLGKRSIHLHVFVALVLSGLLLFTVEEWSSLLLLHRVGRSILFGLNVPLLSRAFSGVRVSWNQDTFTG